MLQPLIDVDTLKDALASGDVTLLDATARLPANRPIRKRIFWRPVCPAHAASTSSFFPILNSRFLIWPLPLDVLRDWPENSD